MATAPTTLYRCHRCGKQFGNHEQLGGHLSVPTCRPRNLISVPAIPAVPPPAAVPTQDVRATSMVGSEFSDDDLHETTPFEEMYQLLQCPCKDDADHLVRPASVRHGSCAPVSNARNTYKLYQVCVNIPYMSVIYEYHL